jgi:hypothetical protein
MLLMIAYQIISGKRTDPYWDMISGAMLAAALCGDSIILLFFDQRWKVSVQEIVSRMKWSSKFR